MKIKFTELKKMDYETGRNLLSKAGYVQNRNEVDGSINDEYYTLFDESGNELHVVSYVTYTKDNLGDEPEYIDREKWHWSEVNGWGGSREGSGRPATGRKRRQYYLNDDEDAKVKDYINELRSRD